MAKPKLIIEIDSKTTPAEVLEIVKKYIDDMIKNNEIYTKEEVDEIIKIHNHDEIYASKDQVEILLNIVNDNDYGGLYEEVVDNEEVVVDNEGGVGR